MIDSQLGELSDSGRARLASVACVIGTESCVTRCESRTEFESRPTTPAVDAVLCCCLSLMCVCLA